MTRIITAKTIKIKIKQGFGLADLADFFRISVEDLKKELYRQFAKKGADSMLRQLSANEKKNKKQQTYIAAPISLDEPVTPITSNNIEEVVEEPCISLETLKEKEASLRSEIFKKEVLHTDLLGKYRSSLRNIEDFKHKLEDYRQLLKNMENEFEIKVAELEDFSEQIRSLNAETLGMRKELEEVSNKINQLNKVAIFVYDNGNIETDGNIDMPNVNLDLQKYSDEKFEVLTIRQIKQLVTLKAIVEALTSQNVKYEIVFDNNNMQEIWEAGIV